MRRSDVMKALCFGLLLLTSLYFFTIDVEAKSISEAPSVKTEAIHERMESKERDSSSDRRDLGSNFKTEAKENGKEWGEQSVDSNTCITLESLESNTKAEKQKPWIQEKNDLIKQVKHWMESKHEHGKMLEQRREEIRTFLSDTMRQWIKDTSGRWKQIFDGIFEVDRKALKEKRSLNKERDSDRQGEDRWFSFDATNQEESKEKESKKKKAKKEQTRNGNDLEIENKVYVNAKLREHIELVYFACGKEREWIVRRETLF